MSSKIKGPALAGIILALAFGAAATAAADELAAGSFEGASGHATSGNVTVVKEAGQAQIVLQPNFRFDGAPDPKVGFGKDGAFDSSTILAPLQKNSGEQHYAVPGSIDPSAYNEVYVWCQRYNVPLGVAKIE